MSSGEKKVAVVLVVVLIAMIGVYFSLGPKSELAGTGGAGLVGGAGAAFAEAEPMGPDDAKVKIVGLVPIVNPCHAATVAALKEVYEEHPNDVQLTLIEFMGPNAMEWKQKLGVTCATVEINGSYRFELDGRNVIFQKQEGMSYIPADIKTVVEAELAKAE